jgi:hypothetical protein
MGATAWYSIGCVYFSITPSADFHLPLRAERRSFEAKLNVGKVLNPIHLRTE